MMHRDPQQYQYSTVSDVFGEASLAPHLPLQLTNGDRSISTAGLLDSGASVNVLPYSAGLALGAVWDQQTTVLHLTGNLARFEARGIELTATVADFPPVQLVFAWTRTQDAPLILGQVNFFIEFNVCFFRSIGMFEIHPR